MLRKISFRNIIGFSVFFIYFILTLILFSLFNNYYISSTKEKYIDANINSTKSIEDYIKKEGENMLAYSHQVSVDQIVRVALNTGMLISIDYRVADAVKIKPMAKFEYTKMAIQLKETKFGWAESSIEREIEIYDKDLKFISSSAKMKKIPSDRKNLEIVKGVHSGMGTEFWTNEITGDSFEIKGYSVVHRDAPLGVIVVKEKMDQIMIEDMKKMSGRELFLYKDNKIIISTLFEKDNKIENRDFLIKNIEEKKYQELLINNRKAIFNFLPLRDNNGKILAYMAVGFYFDEIENMYKKNSIAIFIVEFIFSLVLMIL